jgi:hypothetical protein
MFRYHVTHGCEKKIVAVDNKNDVNRAIIQQFSLPEEPYLLQQWDCDFDDWLMSNMSAHYLINASYMLLEVTDRRI